MRCCLLLLLFTACATGLHEVPPACLSLPRAERITVATKTPAGTIAIRDNSIVNGDKVLAGPFLAIDSFDVSESRGEVVFSAKRKDNFDVGLVAVEGSKIVWVPEDPADEVAVQWAPRGNKVSYVVRVAGGDLVRTVHIPTATSLVVAFPWGRVTSLTWDVAAERYTVVYSTPDASDRREIARYGGEERGITTPPASRLDVTVEPLGTDAIVLRPNDLRYEEKVPVVVWIDDDLYAWNDARAALMKSARVAMVVAKKADVELKEPWMDPTRRFIVGASGEGATSIIPDPKIPAGRYRQSGRVVAVDPALVQSVAACFIADRLSVVRSPLSGERRTEHR